MRVVVQRVLWTRIWVEEQLVSETGPGLMVLLGVEHQDTARDAVYLAEKIANLRVFEDAQGKMNRSLLEVGGEIMLVSQFTLLADCRKGKRPSFSSAAEPAMAAHWYQFLGEKLQTMGFRVATGVFGARMRVESVNDGPVTLLIDSRRSL